MLAGEVATADQVPDYHRAAGLGDRAHRYRVHQALDVAGHAKHSFSLSSGVAFLPLRAGLYRLSALLTIPLRALGIHTFDGVLQEVRATAYLFVFSVVILFFSGWRNCTGWCVRCRRRRVPRGFGLPCARLPRG